MENRNVLSEATIELLKSRQIGLFISALDKERARCLHKENGNVSATHRNGASYCTICRASWMESVDTEYDLNKIKECSDTLINRINFMKFEGGDYMPDELVNHLADTILVLQKLPEIYSEIIDILEEQGREFD